MLSLLLSFIQQKLININEVTCEGRHYSSPLLRTFGFCGGNVALVGRIKRNFTVRRSRAEAEKRREERNVPMKIMGEKMRLICFISQMHCGL